MNSTSPLHLLDTRILHHFAPDMGGPGRACTHDLHRTSSADIESVPSSLEVVSKAEES